MRGLVAVRWVPPDVRPSDWSRLDPTLLTRLAALPGLTATASDVLDELGVPLVVAADVLTPRLAGARIVGQAVTLRYLPERWRHGASEERGNQSRLAHHAAFDLCNQGDVLVIDTAGTRGISSFGGMAAVDAKERGLGGIVVDGGIRDIDEIEAVGLPTWSRSVSPQTGKYRIEAVQINSPIACGGCHVVPGDLVLADPTGVCFIPAELATQAAEAIFDVAEQEGNKLHRHLAE